MTPAILLLEDDPSTRVLLRDLLVDDGHEVTLCESASQVVTVAQDRPGSLALVDAWGPSHEVLNDSERVEIEHLARAVPTIMVTGRSWARHALAAELDLLAILEKPLDLAVLSELIAEARERLSDRSVPRA